MLKKLFSVLSLCILLLLVSCDKQTEAPTPTPLDISEVSFSKVQILLSEGHDSIGAPYGLNKALETAERNGVTYAFEPQIPLAERAECIQATEAILRRIGIDQAIQVNLYTAETYDSTFVENGSVYTHLQDWKSPEYTVSLLYGLLGEYCHYGALYGYASYLGSELWGHSLPTCDKFEGNQNFLDLNLLCFRLEFVSTDDIEIAKKISNTFVSEYIAAHGEPEFLQLLKKSGDIEQADTFHQTLAEFYVSKNVGYTPTDILYRLGGRGYDYIVSCPYAVIYVEKDWVDMNKDMCPYTYDNFLHENYDDVKQYFTINIREMVKYRELFALDSYNDNLNIYFTNHYGQSSYYLAQTHSIVTQNTASLGHEYIHSLTHERSVMEPWAIEGFARYFSYYYNYYGNAMSTVDFNTTDLKYILEYKTNLGRDIDMNTDYAEIYHLMAYCNSYDDPNDAKGYVAGSSFIDYLISRFGEEEVIEIICVTHDFGAYTYDELVADWQAFLQENYAGYTKIR